MLDTVGQGSYCGVHAPARIRRFWRPRGHGRFVFLGLNLWFSYSVRQREEESADGNG